MLFNTTEFLVFFVVFFILYSFVRIKALKLALVIGSSLFFYACWDYRFVPLLAGTALLDFFLARQISRDASPGRRRAWLALSVTANLGVLAFFKYANFALENAARVGAFLGSHWIPPHLAIILPVGVSFYTFQSISYTVDVYRGTFQPRKQVGEFLSAITFFPHLVAGPIVRSSFLLPQFEAMTPTTWGMVTRGFFLIGIGLTKKTIADLLGPVADMIFGGHSPDTAIASWTAALAFAGQIFGDFAGYTDIGTGLALLLGIQFPPNFNVPYISASPVEFWRRWHISLSSWLRDYLYIPLGGSRGSSWLTYRNLFLTMLLGGLWHGASWTFLIWGAYHGALLMINHAVSQRWPSKDGRMWVRVLKIAFTFYLVTVGFVLFRATTLTRALQILRGMHFPMTPSVLSYPKLLQLVLVIVAIVLLSGLDALSARRRDRTERGWTAFAVVTAGLLITFLFDDTRPFLYFQF